MEDPSSHLDFFAFFLIFLIIFPSSFLPLLHLPLLGILRIPSFMHLFSFTLFLDSFPFYSMKERGEILLSLSLSLHPSSFHSLSVCFIKILCRNEMRRDSSSLFFSFQYMLREEKSSVFSFSLQDFLLVNES